MFPDVGKGLGVGLALVLLAIFIGHGIGLACSGDYDGTVETPEESDYADVDGEAELDDSMFVVERMG